jgi:hypothetical protein
MGENLGVQERHMWYLVAAATGAMVFFYLSWQACWHFEVKHRLKELRETTKSLLAEAQSVGVAGTEK